MSPPTDQRLRDRQARLLSHTALKYSRIVPRVASCLRAHDRLATASPSNAPPKPRERSHARA
jgi:hypothetical protein